MELSAEREAERITFADTRTQPRSVITSYEWSGSEAGGRRYSPFVINVEHKKPWHTLTGHQHFYTRLYIFSSSSVVVVDVQTSIEVLAAGEGVPGLLVLDVDDERRVAAPARLRARPLVRGDHRAGLGAGVGEGDPLGLALGGQLHQALYSSVHLFLLLRCCC